MNQASSHPEPRPTPTKPTESYQSLGPFSRAYRKTLETYLKFIIPPKVSLLDVGCGVGFFSESFDNTDYCGVDASTEQIAEAKRNSPEAHFEQGEAENLSFDREYDYILLSDSPNEMTDVQSVLENLHNCSSKDTRLVINIQNTLWRPILAAATALGLKPRKPPQNWLSMDDLENLLDLAGWEIIRKDPRILCPAPLLGIGTLLNKFLAPFLPWLCLTIFFVARPKPRRSSSPEKPSVTVIVPARNEAGNLEAAITRTPKMGSHTELIFVEGNSQDNTWEKIHELIEAYPDQDIKAYQQTGKGKGDAMRLGYDKADGDIIMILDADLTVPPEDLPKFYNAIASGSAEFANGVRLVYPMEDEAMRFLNMCANKFFSLLFSWLLNLSMKDTLCGTKVFTRETYYRIAENRSYFGDFDPFGDFDLIFGAAKLNLAIKDIPVRYKNRVYGEPQIDRWRDGMLLIRMAIFAAKKLKFF